VHRVHPDRPYLYEKLTGMEFMKFIAGLYGMDHASSLQIRIRDLLEMFDLTNWRDELIESYSHGMKQRLVMCSALPAAAQGSPLWTNPWSASIRGAPGWSKDIFMETIPQEKPPSLCPPILWRWPPRCARRSPLSRPGRSSPAEAHKPEENSRCGRSLETVFLKLTEGKRIAHATPLSAS